MHNDSVVYFWLYVLLLLNLPVLFSRAALVKYNECKYVLT